MGLDGSRQHGRSLAPVTVDYYAVLSRAIDASKNNPEQVRSAIYDLARVNMHREILWQQPEISDADLRRHFLALEDAIKRIEAENFDNHVFRADEPVHRLEAQAGTAEKPPAKTKPAGEQPQIFRTTRAAPEPYVFEDAVFVEAATARPPAVDVTHIVEALDVEPHRQPEPPPQEIEVAHVAVPVEVEQGDVEPVDPEPPQSNEWQPEPPPTPVDLDAQYAQFEAAKGHEPPVQTHGELVVLAPEPPMAMQSGPMLQVAPHVIVDYHPPSREFAYPEPPRRRFRDGIGSFIQLTAAALLAVAMFAVMTGQLNIRWLGNKPQTAAVTAAPQAAPPAPIAAAPAVVAAPAPPPPPFPMPATYGVYVLNNDKLTELDRFTIRVPDARVPISPEIREPSRVVVPDGKVAFVVFRRELVNGAPEKVPVRVVARIAREMTFTDGKAATNNVDNLWRIRNSAFDFRVAPVNDNRELIVIRPDADFVLPAGRYALVINGQGYDFAVAGKITSPQQCLERIETVNGAIYSECRSPQLN